jgi:hypothetical protein
MNTAGKQLVQLLEFAVLQQIEMLTTANEKG